MRRRRSALLVLAALAIGILPTLGASGAEPGAGTINLTKPSLEWQGRSWPAGAMALVHGGPEPVCAPPDIDPGVCDHFMLTVDVPASYWKKNPGGVQVTASWPDPNNKLEIAAYDSEGRFVGWGLSGGRSSLVIENPSGTYHIIVDATIIVRPTDYVGTARLIELPKKTQQPSLGGHIAYRGTATETFNPEAQLPSNPVARYHGPRLELAGHPVKEASYEPTIGADRKGNVYINTTPSEPGPTDPVQKRRPPRVRKSSDGGATWTDAGTTDANTFQAQTCDPYIHVDPDYGRLFWLNMVCVGVPHGDTMSYTDDAGASWTHTVVSNGGVNDHETVVAAVPPPGSLLKSVDPAFPKLVYFCANAIVGIQCSRSHDGGRTFRRVANPLLSQTTGCVVSTTDHLSADPEGRIFLGSSGCNIPVVAWSDDAGDTWHDVSITTKIRAAYHDVGTAVDTAGNVYAVFQDDVHSLPFLSVSKDHGQTWSTPVLVAPPDVNEIGMLTIAAGSPGRVAIGMVATTVDNPGDEGRPWSYRMAISQNALEAEPTFVSNAVTLPDLNSKIVNRGGCCSGMADFLDLQRAPTGPGAAWGSLSQACTTAECLTNRDGSNNLARGLAYAIEQVGGPALLEPFDELPGSRLQAAAEPGAVITGPLPATGGNALTAWVAVAALAGACAVPTLRRLRPN